MPCVTDIQVLFRKRELDRHVFPYLHGAIVHHHLEGGALEYPVLTGVFMWATALVANDRGSYLATSVLLLAPLALVVAWLLARSCGWRALLWAAAPALALYAFHNWDLLVVAAAVAGFFSWSRGRTGWAGFWFGIGAALKLYPGFFLAPLVLDRLTAGDRRGALVGGGAGVGTVIATNLPLALINPAGWFATYALHRSRPPNPDTIWRLGLPHIVQINLVSLGLVVGLWLGLMAWGWVRAHREGRFPFVQVCAAMLCAFLLFNKIQSPQYTLWLLPFFALVGVSVAWWAAYSVADLLVYFGIFGWGYSYQFGSPSPELTFARAVLLSGIWLRAGLLLLLVCVFALSRRAIPAVNRERAAG